MAFRSVLGDSHAPERVSTNANRRLLPEPIPRP